METEKKRKLNRFRETLILFKGISHPEHENIDPDKKKNLKIYKIQIN